mgnify:CR=1 FL=1
MARCVPKKYWKVMSFMKDIFLRKVAFHEVADLYSDFVVDHRTLYNVVGMYVFLLCVSSVR